MERPSHIYPFEPAWRVTAARNRPDRGLTTVARFISFHPEITCFTSDWRRQFGYEAIGLGKARGNWLPGGLADVQGWKAAATFPPVGNRNDHRRRRPGWPERSGTLRAGVLARPEEGFGGPTWPFGGLRDEPEAERGRERYLK